MTTFNRFLTGTAALAVTLLAWTASAAALLLTVATWAGVAAAAEEVPGDLTEYPDTLIADLGLRR